MGVLEKTIRDLSEAFEIINHSRETKFNPTITFLSSIFFVSAVAFTDNLLVLVSCLLIGLSMPLISEIDASRFYKLFSFSLLFLLSISSYMFLSSRRILAEINIVFFNERVWLPFYIIFILRSITAIVIFEVFVAYLGIRNIARCLSQLRVPKKIIALFAFFVAALNRNLREASRKILARYSRILIGGLRREWKLISSIVGDLFIGSINNSHRIFLGLKSRGFDMEKYCIETHNVSLRDILLILATASVFILAYI